MFEQRSKLLRNLINSNELEVIMEAHSGLAAKVAEHSGFRGIWASGLSISTMLGIRDSNEATWTESLNILEFMSDATNIPILFDGDTGFGNFNNVRRLVSKLCQRGVAGVAIEDKLFPKTNSFIDGRQDLAEVNEFCGRIKAGKDTQTCEDFVLIARTESLISGKGINEALDRAHAYVDAGADGIFIHSKLDHPGEIQTFCELWKNRAPLVIAPTTYCTGSFDIFEDFGVSLLICANHAMRASMAAMMLVTREIRESRSFTTIEHKISSLADVFSLLNYEELKNAEKRYLSLTD